MIKNPFLKRLSTKKFQLNQLKIGLVTILRVTKSILNYPERWGLGFTLTINWPLLYLVETKLTKKILAKYDKKWLSYGPIRDSAALYGILQCCRVTVLYLD